ncbi:HIT domain-containing protein [Lactococcus hircilactis]|uniref:HIT domain-containing protein n=1 Tax=Lactococcus hircilactis TaxID=1494462 RepID=A0A7X1ZAT6_9LACT|nr:HIT family protein [Lactococcus hircilactis]MQW39660.1 HIT domain-containing protein [Lactococcus hircilactis]
MTCIFCETHDVLFENDTAKCFFDHYPVSKGHLLIVPKRHEANFFELSSQEKHDMDELLEHSKTYLDEHEHPDAYNVGINVGKAAGQTVFHCHVHLIPRYTNDVENPIGGVRGVIPQKQHYQSK